METNTEQQILIAAKKLFLEKGFAMTSTAEIAREAGCNTAMIHYYYRTKDNLFTAVFMNEFKKFSQSFIAMSDTEGTVEERIRSFIGAHFDFIRENPKIPFLLINELTTNPDRIDQLKEIGVYAMGQILSKLQVLVDQEVANGKIRPVNAIDLAMNGAMMNIMTFLMMPIVLRVSSMDEKTYIESRKKSIADTIINSIIIPQK